MTVHDEVAQGFPSHIAQHIMTVYHDQGMYRHLTFKNPATFNRFFHITTWPGYLCISGDMGCYVFARLPDMFEFFRGGGINPDYWAEKLQADEKHSGHSRPCVDKYTAALKEDFDAWEFLRCAEREAVWQDIQSELIDTFSPDDIVGSVERASDYTAPFGGHRFVDVWECNFEEFTHHYLWCCHAIRWAIEQYDAMRAPANDNAPATKEAANG